MEFNDEIASGCYKNFWKNWNKIGRVWKRQNQTQFLLLIRWRITSALTDDPINGNVSNENVESRNQLKRDSNKN